MAVTLDNLDPKFAAPLKKLIAQCADRGLEMRPYNGLRTPLAQARLWRQSRAIEEIKAKIDEYRNAGASFLADCLVKAEPQLAAFCNDQSHRIGLRPHGVGRWRMPSRAVQFHR